MANKSVLMHPAENVPQRAPVYFSALIKEIKKKGYSFVELVEEETCTLILKCDKTPSEAVLQPIPHIGITPKITSSF